MDGAVGGYELARGGAGEGDQNGSCAGEGAVGVEGGGGGGGRW